MTRIVLLALCLALAPGASAQDTTDIHHRPKVTQTTPGVSAEEVAQLWTEVQGLSAVEAGQLLDRITELAASKNAPVSSLSAQSSDLLRHYAAFKGAHERSAGGQGVEVETLYAQVFEGKASADVSHLGRVAAGYFTLHHQYDQLVKARFLATNATDREIAEASAARAQTYEANILTAATELKGLLAARR